MIRIIRARDERGIPTEWDDYPDREIGEVTGRMALRFDSELMALKTEGLSLGVRRWTEAVARIRRFSAEAAEWMAHNFGDDSTIDEDLRVVALEEWLSTNPDYWLAQQVGIWSAVNLAGGAMTLAGLLDLADRDVENIDDPPPYIPDEDGDVEGKAELADS